MGWSLGFDSTWNRDIGYGVPAYCDHPGCSHEIDRGLSYVCGGDAYGGDHGCGLFFCSAHQRSAGAKRNHAPLCQRCYWGRQPFAPSAEHPKWVEHKLFHRSWAGWRKSSPIAVKALVARWVEIQNLSEPPKDILSNITVPPGFVLVGPGMVFLPRGHDGILPNNVRRIFKLAEAMNQEQKWRNNP